MITSDQLNLPGVTHGFFTRQGGYSSGIFSSLNCGLGSGDDIALVTKNRAKVADDLGKLTCPKRRADTQVRPYSQASSTSRAV